MRVPINTGGGNPLVVETSRDVNWVIVADRTQEPAARMILARAVLNGVKTALVLSEDRRHCFIRLYPVLSMAIAVRIACPVSEESLSAALSSDEATGETRYAEIVPIVCRHCGETHAWARKEDS
jgi:hypothetical protein